MQFYVAHQNGLPPNNAIYPCVALRHTPWDDYGYKTSYQAIHFDEQGVRTYIGHVKILHHTERDTSRVLPASFGDIPDDFCSLGQGFDYYRSLVAFDLHITGALRDIADDHSISSDFRRVEGFNDSLLRSTEAKLVYAEVAEYLEKNRYPIVRRKFGFQTQLTGAAAPHCVEFDFSGNGLIPNRYFAIIGRNGVGKTRFLVNLANTIGKNKLEQGKITPAGNPPFSRVIALSYSAFDPFDHLIDKDNERYVYCGLKNNNNEISHDILNTKLIAAFELFWNRGRQPVWKRIMGEVMQTEVFRPLLPQLGEVYEDGRHVATLDLSAGHLMIICILADIVGSIEIGSLIVFDEPELHLHPSALADMLKSVYQLLREFDSYAIISTHSPTVLQDIPSKYVRIIDRISDEPFIREPDTETFGANQSTISNLVYGANGTEPLYLVHIRRMLQTATSQEIIDSFGDELSLSVRGHIQKLSKEVGA